MGAKIKSFACAVTVKPDMVLLSVKATKLPRVLTETVAPALRSIKLVAVAETANLPAVKADTLVPVSDAVNVASAGKATVLIDISVRDAFTVFKAVAEKLVAEIVAP
jgi:hypothetical protein